MSQTKTSAKAPEEATKLENAVRLLKISEKSEQAGFICYLSREDLVDWGHWNSLDDPCSLSRSCKTLAKNHLSRAEVNAKLEKADAATRLEAKRQRHLGYYYPHTPKSDDTPKTNTQVSEETAYRRRCWAHLTDEEWANLALTPEAIRRAVDSTAELAKRHEIAFSMTGLEKHNAKMDRAWAELKLSPLGKDALMDAKHQADIAELVEQNAKTSHAWAEARHQAEVELNNYWTEVQLQEKLDDANRAGRPRANSYPPDPFSDDDDDARDDIYNHAEDCDPDVDSDNEDEPIPDPYPEDEPIPGVGAAAA